MEEKIKKEIRSWEEKKFKELNNLTFHQWWEAGEKENKRFICQLLCQKKKETQELKEELRWYKKQLKQYVRFFSAVLDGEKPEEVAKRLKLLK